MLTPFFIDWNVDPALFRIGAFEVRYYALCWIAAFLIGLYIFGKMLKKENLNPKLSDSIFLYAFISTLIGARLGHCIFYESAEYWQNPWQVFNLRQGGLASHGAAIGMLIGLWLFSRKHKIKYIWTLDRVVTVIPIGGALIRLGNLFNSEIYGDPTGSSYGFRFIENIYEWANERAVPIYSLPSHPTQIYEAVIYTLIFILLMYLYFKKNIGTRYPGLLFALFLITVFGSRFFIETIKNPQDALDATRQMTLGLNTGQLLSIPFIIIGFIILYMSIKHKFSLSGK